MASIDRELEQHPPALLSKGSIIAEGVSQELDELRSIAFGGKAHLEEMRGEVAAAETAAREACAAQADTQRQLEEVEAALKGDLDRRR